MFAKFATVFDTSNKDMLNQNSLPYFEKDPCRSQFPLEVSQQLHERCQRTFAFLRQQERGPFLHKKFYMHLPERLYPHEKKMQITRKIHQYGGLTAIAPSTSDTIVIFDENFSSDVDLY